MTAPELTRAWLDELSALELVDAGDRDTTARDNMMSFSVADAQDASVEAAELAAFMRDAYRAYTRAAARRGLDGWFYAWHDAQAGQLRMSAAWIASVSELPFAARITVVDDPAVIAEDALASELGHGVPLSALADEPPGPTPDPPPLAVFARPLLRVL